jgi:hypothetical protein
MGASHKTRAEYSYSEHDVFPFPLG